ncbi:MAG TPA: PadR family transcriptional regulator [Streptosporangiaceae bacterium]
MAGKRRRVSNPLALAVLSTLRERPMHPYEMAATMRSQGKERSIKLNYGSLYTVVDNLAKHGLIEAMEASREGRRPERTVYRLTEPGRAELEDWLTELLGTPVKEYPQFEAALAEIAVLNPGQARDVLERRVEALEQALAQERAEIAQLTWLPRLFLIENEYHLAIGEAELAWVRSLVRELQDGSFPLMKEWDHWTRTGEFPAGLAAELYEAAGWSAPVVGAVTQTAAAAHPGADPDPGAGPRADAEPEPGSGSGSGSGSGGEGSR